MKKIKILVFSAILISCSSTQKQQFVTIIGTAEESKVGATVISNKDNKRYFVDGIVSWDKDVRYKQIRVSGILVVKKNKYKSSVNGIPAQQIMGGVSRIIMKPIWKLEKDSIN